MSLPHQRSHQPQLRASLALLFCGSVSTAHALLFCRNHSHFYFFFRAHDWTTNIFFHLFPLQLTTSPSFLPLFQDNVLGQARRSCGHSIALIRSLVLPNTRERGGRGPPISTARKRDGALRTRSFARSVCSNRNSGVTPRWIQTGISTFQQERQA